MEEGDEEELVSCHWCMDTGRIRYGYLSGYICSCETGEDLLSTTLEEIKNERRES